MAQGLPGVFYLCKPSTQLGLGRDLLVYFGHLGFFVDFEFLASSGQFFAGQGLHFSFFGLPGLFDYYRL